VIIQVNRYATQEQLRGWWARVSGLFRVLRLVVKGYVTGQPIDEERPRKGCC
jgi:hypothetical protein